MAKLWYRCAWVGAHLVESDDMPVLDFSSAKNVIIAAWRAINGDTPSYGNFDPYEREPLERNEFAKLFDTKLTQPSGIGLSQYEQSERDLMCNLRQIIHD
jgi:hypothetical protein